MSDHDFDVALSFAGEDRAAAEKLLAELESRKIRVFYDKDEASTLWGRDLVEALHEVYSKRARYCIMFVSKHYLEKRWPRHERRSAFERALADDSQYILPLRLDDTELPGLPSTIRYERYSEHRVSQIADLVARKIGLPSSEVASTRPTAVLEGSSTVPFAELASREREAVFARVERHRPFSDHLLPRSSEKGFFAIHSLLPEERSIEKTRLDATFLNAGKNYDAILHYSRNTLAHQEGFTRIYDIGWGREERVVTAATTCYSTGHIVCEGYLDRYLEGKRVINPNWWLYEIQRQMQLAKEVFTGYGNALVFIVSLENVVEFHWPIFEFGAVSEISPYVGYHRDIVSQVPLDAIHGRDRWNLKMDVAVDVLKELARVFGLSKLPAVYWDTAGELDYSKGIPER